MEMFSINEYTSRRSDVLGLNGIVATSNPLAANAGLDILKKGGNCVDAAVCAASVLNVVDPMSTGIGGDVFALIYDKSSSSVKALNGSGRSGRNSTIEDFAKFGLDHIPLQFFLSKVKSHLDHDFHLDRKLLCCQILLN